MAQKKKKETILITGGAGFIGSFTADGFAEKGYRVRIVDNLAEPVHDGKWPKYVQRKGYELIRGDVRDKKVMRKALKGVDYVYHIAAYQDQRPDFSKFFETNTTSTALLYELIQEDELPIKKVVLASTQFLYGDGLYRCDHGGKRRKIFMPELRTREQMERDEWEIACPHGKEAKLISFKEDQEVNPTNSYGLSKRAAEMLAFRLGKTYGISTTALRYSIVQGPRQSPRNLYSGALRIFVTQALKGEPITVYEDGMQKRDLVNIEDVVRANLFVLGKKETNFEAYNVGGGKGYTVLQFARMVKKITNSDSQIVIGGYRRTDTRHAISDISKLKKLGWKPRYTPEKSIEDYVEWYTTEFTA